MVQERVGFSGTMTKDADNAAVVATSPMVDVMHYYAVERVIQTMRTQFAEPLSLTDLADMACLSPYHFCRIFQRIVGIPPIEFLASVRLDAAKRLLLTTKLSVTDICFAVGYLGLGSFTTRFTQLVGVSPRLLRQRAQCPVTVSFPVSQQLPASIAPNCLSGQVYAPATFNGHIFIGLFPRPIPQGQPVRCTRLMAPGPFQLVGIPPGRYYLLSAAVPCSTDPYTYLLPEKHALVAVHGPLLLEDQAVPAPVELHLRPPCLTDPPVIMALGGNS